MRGIPASESLRVAWLRRFFGNFFLPLLCFASTAGRLAATEYYLDPVAGNNSNPGTRAAPWGSLETVAKSGKSFAAGDALILLNGYHGSPALRNINPGEVIVRPDAGARASVRHLTIKKARFWTVIGLEVCAGDEPTKDRTPLISISEGSDNIVRGCLVYTVFDTSKWSASDWNTKSCNGIWTSGTRQVIENNHIFNVNFAVTVAWEGSHDIVRGNLIEDFAGDGMRGLGDSCRYEGNVVKNLHQVNQNHPDAFQSWSQTEHGSGVGQGVVRDVIVAGNLFIAYDNPHQPNRGPLQGVGCFDGYYEDWLVENNVIITSAYHGISFYGARNCRIVNNTVVDISPNDRVVPWIMITKHKKAGGSSGNLVRNNLSAALHIDPGTAKVDHNIKINSNRSSFVNWEARDLRPAPHNSAIGAGTWDGAPETDFTGAPRKSSASSTCDAGAFQFGAEVAGENRQQNPPWEPRLTVPPKPTSAAPAPTSSPVPPAAETPQPTLKPSQ